MCISKPQLYISPILLQPSAAYYYSPPFSSPLSPRRVRKPRQRSSLLDRDFFIFQGNHLNLILFLILIVLFSAEDFIDFVGSVSFVPDFVFRSRFFLDFGAESLMKSWSVVCFCDKKKVKFSDLVIQSRSDCSFAWSDLVFLWIWSVFVCLILWFSTLILFFLLDLSFFLLVFELFWNSISLDVCIDVWFWQTMCSFET